MTSLTLNNGISMPQQGLGVFQIPDAAECRQSVLSALETGYRLIDTAACYGNERAVGEAVKRSGLPREAVFLTSKVWIQDAGYEKTLASFEKTLDNLGTDYLDLYLIHMPYGDYHGSWRAMETLLQAGRVRAIGVCNFNAARLLDFCESVEVKPAVDQVEMHPFFHQRETVAVMMQYNVAPEAWGPFAEGKLGIFTNPVLTEIGQAHGKTAAQVALRWNTQRGVVVIPKSIHRERMEQNLNIWDFTLTGDEMARIGALDLGHSKIVDHNDPRFIKMLHDLKVHA